MRPSVKIKQQCILCLQQPHTDIPGVPKAIWFDHPSKASWSLLVPVGEAQLRLLSPCLILSEKNEKAQQVVKLSGDVLHWHLVSALHLRISFSSSGDWWFLMPTKEWISSPYVFFKSTSIFKLKMTKAKVWDTTSDVLLEWPLGLCAPCHLAAEQQEQLVCLCATSPLSPHPRLLGVGVKAVPTLSPSGNNGAQNPLLSRSPIHL